MKLGYTLNGRFIAAPRWLSKFVRFGLQAPISRIVRGATLGAQLAAFDEQGRILLIRQSYSPDWQFPGGGVGTGETVKEAAIREMYEEAGGRPADAVNLFGIYSNFCSMPGDHVILFVCRRVTVEQFPAPNREIVAHGFFAPDALPDNTSPAVYRRLAEINNEAEKASNW